MGDTWDQQDDTEERRQRQKKLERRAILRKRIEEKYPEVYLLLMEFYQERHW